MKYCPKCDNIMDVSRTVPQVTHDTNQTNLNQTNLNETNLNETSQNPTSLSSTDKSININVEHTSKIINMYTKGFDITNEHVDIEQLQKNPEFTKLKEKDRKELTKILKNMDDETLSAYMMCKNCSYSEKIIKRTMILNKMNTYSILGENKQDYSKYKYMRYVDILPHTRDYICKNKTCPTHKNSELRDAKWFRPTQDSYETFYVCCACGTVWNNT